MVVDDYNYDPRWKSMIAAPHDIIASDLGSSGASVNNKKNSRFDLFTNIFKKRSKDQETSEVSESKVSVLDDPDQEISVVPTLTCNATSLITSRENISARASQPIDIFQPMGHNRHETHSSDNESQYEPYPGTPTVLSKSPVSPRVRSLHHDMQALRRSRQDNPYIQHKLEKLSLQEETPFSSPRKQEQEKLVESEEDSEMEEDIVNLHEHLIRSPPPQFPQNVSQFMFPDRGSPDRRTSTDSHSVDSPIMPPLRSDLSSFRNKGSLPLLPIEEIQSSESNKRFQKTDLNPLMVKSGVDMLDPSMREVLEFQKHKIVYDSNRSDSVTSPGESNGRMSVDGALHHHHHHPYQRTVPLNGKLQPMWSPPATAPSNPTSPRSVSFPTGGPVLIGPTPPNFTPLPNLGPILPPVTHPISQPELRPVKGVKLLPTPNNAGPANGSRTMVN